MSGKNRFAMASTIAFMILVWVAPIAQAQAKTVFDLPAQPLADSLRAVGSQTNINLLFDPPLVAGRQAPALKAEATADEALSRLLVGTGISHEFLNETTIVLAKADAVGRKSSKGGASPSAASGAAGQDGPKEGDKNPDSFRVAQVDQKAAGPQTIGYQNSARKDEGLAEIIVTAQKREERLINVPISIVALSGDELQQRQITSLDDLPSAVPGLAIQTNGANRYIELRGISNNVGAAGADAPLIGMYIDEMDVTLGAFYQINPSTYDLQRVEVLRGPQGTLYGEGSAGGTIRFITNDPNLNGFAMASDVAAMFTQDGAPSQRINTMLNVPLADGQFALRFVGTFDHEGGWIDQPAADRKDINDQNLTNVRLKGLWKPNEQLSVSAMAELYRDNRSTGTGEDSSGNFVQVFSQTTTPAIQDAHDIYNVTVKYDFSNVRILNSASYIRASNNSQDTGFHYQILQPPALPFDYYTPQNFLDDHVLEDELRLASTGQGPWQWTVGGFYRHFHDDFEYPAAYEAQPGPAGTPLPPPFSYQSGFLLKDWSAFGDTSYKLMERLTLGAGVRYFKDDQEYNANASGFISNQTGSFHSVDPRVYAQYEIAEAANVYASAAKGFRSGGFNFVQQTPTFDPEEVWTYELGTKASLFESRFRSEIAIFYSDYKNYQVVGVAPPPNALYGSITTNAGAARIEGIEGNFAWKAADQWTLSLNGNYLRTRFYEINATSTAYQVGDPLDLVPKYQFDIAGQRDFTWQDRAGYIRLDYSQQGRETYRNRTIGPWYFNESDVINMLNFHASVWCNKNLRLGILAQNLLNDRGFLSTGSNELNAARARPRTYGIEFGVNFD